MNIHDDLALEWADIPGEGLVRVFTTASFKDGIALTAQIGEAASGLGRFPEVLITPVKVTVTIPADIDGRDHQLAHVIDKLIDDDTNT